MLFLTLKMASEGGGKLKQKRPHTAKPYDRPKVRKTSVTVVTENGRWKVSLFL